MAQTNTINDDKRKTYKRNSQRKLRDLRESSERCAILPIFVVCYANKLVLLNRLLLYSRIFIYAYICINNSVAYLLMANTARDGIKKKIERSSIASSIVGRS